MSNDLYRQIRGAWEVHATTKMGMDAGRALSQFDHFIEGLMAQSEVPEPRVLPGLKDLMGRKPLFADAEQGEPSDAQIYDAETAFWEHKERTGIFKGAMHAALRAAWGAR